MPDETVDDNTSVAKRILVTGSRDWTDESMVTGVLLQAWARLGKPDAPILVSGGCPTGADDIAERLWHYKGWPVERHTANWALFGRSAGPRRNKDMVDAGADYCCAFILNGSKGASFTLRLAKEAGIPFSQILAENRGIDFKTTVIKERSSLNPGDDTRPEDIFAQTQLDLFDLRFEH